MDTVRAAGRHLRAQMAAAPEEQRTREAAMRVWDNIFEALQHPAAFGRRRYKALVQQHAEVIISALQRRDAGARCSTAGRPVPAGPVSAQTDAAKRPAAAASAAADCSAAHSALLSKKSAGKGGCKARAAPKPAAGGDAAAAETRAQAAMDELILEEVGCPTPTPRLSSAALPIRSETPTAAVHRSWVAIRCILAGRSPQRCKKSSDKAVALLPHLLGFPTRILDGPHRNF